MINSTIYLVFSFLVVLYDLHSLLGHEINLEDLKHHAHWSLLPHRHCGRHISKPFNNMETNVAPRIVMGDSPYHGEFPWMVNIFRSYKKLKDNKPHCGGSIISKQYILTAAHCCREKNNSKNSTWWVRVGENDLKGPEMGPNGPIETTQDIPVSQRIPNTGYDEERHNDICLLRLSQTLHFNDYVRPICLPTAGELRLEDFAGSVMEVAGWGRTEEGLGSPKLLFQEFTVIALKTCRKEFKRVSHEEICVGMASGSVCKGDSGGPLMKSLVVDGKSKYFQFGIVSYGKKTCDPRSPTVFTRVTRFIDWILDNIAP